MSEAMAPDEKANRTACCACGSKLAIDGAAICKVCMAPQGGKQCIVCKQWLPKGAIFCKDCKAPQQGKKCVICKQPLPKGAKRCNACTSYRSAWLRWLPLVASTFSMLFWMVGACTGVRTAVVYLHDRESDTKFKVTGDDVKSGLEIYLKAWNTGRKASSLARYRLKFDGALPIKDAVLRLGDKDQQKAANVIAAGGSAPITLALYTNDELHRKDDASAQDAVAFQNDLADKIAKHAAITLEIDVEESDDPSSGFWRFWPWSKLRQHHIREDHFEARLIKEFILKAR